MTGATTGTDEPEGDFQEFRLTNLLSTRIKQLIKSLSLTTTQPLYPRAPAVPHNMLLLFLVYDIRLLFVAKVILSPQILYIYI